MAAWHLSCRNCNQRLARFNIEDDFENLYLPVRPDLLKGGKEFECPNCGHKAIYHQTDVTYALQPLEEMLRAEQTFQRPQHELNQNGASLKVTKKSNQYDERNG